MHTAGSYVIWPLFHEAPPIHLPQQENINASTMQTDDHPSTLSPALHVLRRCLAEHGSQHTWLVFIDSDEFLMFRQGPAVQSLPALLKVGVLGPELGVMLHIYQ